MFGGGIAMTNGGFDGSGSAWNAPPDSHVSYQRVSSPLGSYFSVNGCVIYG
jgi:hypothetical protein